MTPTVASARPRSLLSRVIVAAVVLTLGSTAGIGTAAAGGLPSALVLASGVRLLGSVGASATGTADGLVRVSGGDADVRNSTIAGRRAWITGNGAPIGSDPTPDHYLVFAIGDGELPKVRYRALVDISYLDRGTDTFAVEYDGKSAPFSLGGGIVKSNSGNWRTASFLVCDPKFARRANGGDVRIDDGADGAEAVSSVRIRFTASPGSGGLRADAFGANPYDGSPDSRAIQGMLDTAVCSGDKVIFTGGTKGGSGYRGYQVDRTLFLTGMSAKHDLTFTSSSTARRALFTATAGLKGYVMRLFARSRPVDAGRIDRITLSHLEVDGNRARRVCSGADGSLDGVGDNWGSWLPGEMAGSAPGDPWGSPGNIGLDAAYDHRDPTQAWTTHPSAWSTGFVVQDVVSRNAECGSGLSINGAGILVSHLHVINVGDHVHEVGCAFVDNDGDSGGWSDGITTFGPDITIRDSEIVNPSDLGIAFFGGRRLRVSNVQIRLTSGNHGAFGAIGLHGQLFGDVSGSELTGITVSSSASTTCGGFHAGIDVGPFMWSGGCWGVLYSQVGVPGPCAPSTTAPPDPLGGICGDATSCTQWIWADPRAPLVIRGNTVSDAHIDYVVGGMSGGLVFESNIAGTPRWSDWHAARFGCTGGWTWAPMTKAAFAPYLVGWNQVPVLCER